jgi:hypothetical protein
MFDYEAGWEQFEEEIAVWQEEAEREWRAEQAAKQDED